jgi:hypothetical protein
MVHIRREQHYSPSFGRRGDLRLAGYSLITNHPLPMDLSTFANLVNAIAVSAGVIFAAAQIREFRRQRRRQSERNRSTLFEW